MAITASPFVMKDTSLTLKKVGDASATEYKCQLTQAQLTPSESGGGGGGNTLSTFCEDYSDAASATTTWALELAGFQSFADAQDFALWAFDNEGDKAEFVLTPGQGGATISATNPGFSGEVTIKPTIIGGTAKQYALFTVSLPCSVKPTKITTPVVAFAE